MKKVDIYTDGACSGNPGAGGWAAVLIFNGKQKRISGYGKSTTNNRMELFSVIQGLAQLKESCEVTVYSDSAYVVNAFNSFWIDNWTKNGWKNSNNEEIKNKDLWTDLLQKASVHKVSFVKVKGHSDNEFNNLCDEMARQEITNYGNA